MFSPGILTFQEFAMREPLPIATIQEAVLEFLRGREDVAVFEAQAVNAYVHEARMTQDIDLVSPRAEALAEELQDYLSERSHIAVRVRRVGDGRGFRVDQVRKEGNRHLVDVQSVETLPETRMIANVLVIAPAVLLAYKVIAYAQRRSSPKSGTDWRDIAMLLLAFPELKRDPGPVRERLEDLGAGEGILEVWKAFVEQEIKEEEE
jgi:hypothetical protein